MKKFSTKGIVFLAMMTALSMVFARLISINVDPATLRLSLTNVPVILASLWFGPIAGAFVGFVSDFVGASVLSPYGWNPLLAPTSLIMGLLPGLLKPLFLRNYGFIRLCGITLITNAIGTIAYSTFALSQMSGLEYSYVLAIRLPAYILIALVEAICIYYLTKSGLDRVLFAIPGRWWEK